MMIQPLPIAGKLPIKTLVARQLPKNAHIPSTHGTMYVYSLVPTLSILIKIMVLLIIDYRNNYYELLLL